MRPLLLFAALPIAVLSQTVSESDSNIYYTAPSGMTRQLTFSGLDYSPSLSFDHKWVVFVRRPVGAVDDIDIHAGTQIWMSNVDGTAVKLLAADEQGRHPRLVGIVSPQFSPDGSKIYFMIRGTVSGAVVMMTLQTGEMRELFGGLTFEVVRHGEFRGYLIVYEDVFKRTPGRLFMYTLRDPDGKFDSIIGEKEHDVLMFREIHVDDKPDPPQRKLK